MSFFQKLYLLKRKYEIMLSENYISLKIIEICFGLKLYNNSVFLTVRYLVSINFSKTKDHAFGSFRDLFYRQLKCSTSNVFPYLRKYVKEIFYCIKHYCIVWKKFLKQLFKRTEVLWQWYSRRKRNGKNFSRKKTRNRI